MSQSLTRGDIANATFWRRLTIITFPPAFPLLFAHGLSSGYPFPALGLLPLAASALLGALFLNRDNIAIGGSPIRALSQSNIFYADILIAFVLFAFLIPSWIMMDMPYNRSVIALGAYSTVFMMLNCGIHTYFVLQRLSHMLANRSCDCPHCRTVRGGTHVLPVTTEYTPLSSGDEYSQAQGVDADGEVVI